MGYMTEIAKDRPCAICAKFEAARNSNCCQACEELKAMISLGFRRGDPEAMKGMPK